MREKQNKPQPRYGPPLATRRTLSLTFWAVLICCVVIGSLAPAASRLIVDIAVCT